MRPQKLIAVLCLLPLLILLAACSEQTVEATPSSTPPPRSITVLGSGKVYLTPDVATISIGVHSEDENAARAVSDNNSQAQEISEILLSMDVLEDDIQTSNFNIYLQQVYDDSGNHTGTEYIVDNTVLVTVRDLDQLGEIMGTVVEAGANSIFGIQFDISDKTIPLSEARRAAIEDARLKAEELALAAGVALGDVQSINESGGEPVPVFEGKEGGGFDTTTAQVPVSLGQLSLTVEVSVTYEIR